VIGPNKPIISEGSFATIKREQSLFEKWDGLPNNLRGMLEEIRGESNALTRIAEFVQSLVALVDLDVDVALYHAVRQETADLYYYGYRHAIQTAMLCQLMARRLAWPAQKMMSLMSAAITMNVPIFSLQGQLAKQDVPVRESQRTVIRQHPHDAHEWLVEIGVADQDWLTAVNEHHERTDGSGYPQALHQVSELAVALRVADVFMAKISHRTLRSALSIKDAAKQLYSEDHGGALSLAIIKEFGIFPPGEVVRLTTGEIGVVMRRTASGKSPIVAVVTDSAGHLIARTHQRDTSKAEFVVLGSITPPDFISRLPPERIYGYVPVKAIGSSQAQ
jgi:HD-GYP domain-containing protein (c-di-GMP phosphodiesterase class II)